MTTTDSVLADTIAYDLLGQPTVDHTHALCFRKIAGATFSITLRYCTGGRNRRTGGAILWIIGDKYYDHASSVITGNGYRVHLKAGWTVKTLSAAIEKFRRGAIPRLTEWNAREALYHRVESLGMRETDLLIAYAERFGITEFYADMSIDDVIALNAELNNIVQTLERSKNVGTDAQPVPKLVTYNSVIDDEPKEQVSWQQSLAHCWSKVSTAIRRLALNAKLHFTGRANAS